MQPRNTCLLTRAGHDTVKRAWPWCLTGLGQAIVHGRSGCDDAAVTGGRAEIGDGFAAIQTHRRSFEDRRAAGRHVAHARHRHSANKRLSTRDNRIWTVDRAGVSIANSRYKHEVFLYRRLFKNTALNRQLGSILHPESGRLPSRASRRSRPRSVSVLATTQTLAY